MISLLRQTIIRPLERVRASPLAIVVASLLSWSCGAEPETLLKPEDAETTARGRAIYATHCAACHGARLEGQPNWRLRGANGRLPAPPHDDSGHTWHHSDRMLFELTKTGAHFPDGYQTDMPKYEGVLSDAEIVAVLSYIKSTWSEEVRGYNREVNRSN